MLGPESSWKLGCAFGGIGVCLGAFGAHILTAVVSSSPDGPTKLANWSTATTYLYIHSLALLATSLKQKDDRSLAPVFFTTGIVAFSGSIYLLTILKSQHIKRLLGPITPVGGLFFVAGWISLMNL